jgi:hypothetical protein
MSIKVQLSEQEIITKPVSVDLVPGRVDVSVVGNETRVFIPFNLAPVSPAPIEVSFSTVVDSPTIVAVAGENVSPIVFGCVVASAVFPAGTTVLVKNINDDVAQFILSNNAIESGVFVLKFQPPEVSPTVLAYLHTYKENPEKNGQMLVNTLLLFYDLDNYPETATPDNADKIINLVTEQQSDWAPVDMEKILGLLKFNQV